MTACMYSCGKLWTTEYERTKSSNANSENPGQNSVLCMHPALSTT